MADSFMLYNKNAKALINNNDIFIIMLIVLCCTTNIAKALINNAGKAF